VNGHGRHSLGPGLLAVAVVALITGPVILYNILPVAGVPSALASGLVVLIAVKHLGLVAVLLTPLYALVRRRPRR
jgi:hypothetical protein